MNIAVRALVLIGIAHFSSTAAAQSMAIAWDLYVFPSNQQTPEVQMNEERECTQWSRQMTGVDPANPAAGVRVEIVDPGAIVGG